MYHEGEPYPFEYRGYRFGIRTYGGSYYYHTENLTKRGIYEVKLKNKDWKKVLAEVHSIIDVLIDRSEKKR